MFYKSTELNCGGEGTWNKKNVWLFVTRKMYNTGPISSIKSTNQTTLLIFCCFKYFFNFYDGVPSFINLRTGLLIRLLQLSLKMGKKKNNKVSKLQSHFKKMQKLNLFLNQRKHLNTELKIWTKTYGDKRYRFLFHEWK